MLAGVIPITILSRGRIGDFIALPLGGKMKQPYKMIDHTGDAGAFIWGESMEDIFANAAIAMTDMLIDRGAVQPNISREIELDGEDQEDLLVRWLSELNYMVSAEGEIYTDFEIEHITETHLCASVTGDEIDPEKHRIKTEIKAVTYHQLYIKETEDGYEARVIFDL